MHKDVNDDQDVKRSKELSENTNQQELNKSPIHIRRMLQQYDGKWVQVSYCSNHDTLQVDSVQDTTKRIVIEIELPTYYPPEIDNSMEDNPWNCESGYLALPLEMYNKYYYHYLLERNKRLINKITNKTFTVSLYF